MHNVLLITADQWRAECLSALGHPVLRTPHLDALAKEGVTFKRHYTQCVPCGPSRTSLLTGMYARNHRSVRNGTPLDARFTSLALEMRKLGYDPALIGYTDTSLDPRGRPASDPALHTYAGTMPGFTQLVPGSEGQRAWVATLRDRGYAIPEGEDMVFEPPARTAANAGWGPTFAPARYKAEDSDTAFAVGHAIHYATHATKPWFLHLSLLRPHPPFIAPEPYNSMYDPAKVPGFLGQPARDEEGKIHPFMAYMLHDLRDQKRDGHPPGGHPMDERARRQLRATYYGLMTEVDDQLGRLFAALKATGAYDNTLIVFTTDHGEQLWDHWVLGKEFYFDQSFHIPLIVRAPGALGDRARGRMVDAFSESIDLMPTIIDLSGGEPPLQCDGVSLRPWLAGQTPAGWRDSVICELDFRDVTDAAPERELGLGLDECSLVFVRDKTHKYVHFAGLPPLLFDLVRDPSECVNAIAEPDQVPHALRMAQKLATWTLAKAERTMTGMRLSKFGLQEAERGRRIAGRRI